VTASTTASPSRPKPVRDVREELLRAVRARRVTAAIVADEPGVLAGTAQAIREAEALGLSVVALARDGSALAAGEEIARLTGSPAGIVRAEEVLLGLLAKPSGIATRTRAFVTRANGRPRVVSGGWKKMPGALKDMIRGAIVAGGGEPRILARPFAYLDKNWVALLGGVRSALAAVAHLDDLAKVIQVKGRHGDLAAEACEAAEGGAAVVFVDTGRPEDVARVAAALAARGLRRRVELAFGGGVTLDDVERLRALDVDVLDVGRQIVDAPLLDMRLDVVDARRTE
jgi:nicotinate-nucleotide pyrophosphorylase (carboxylating)